MEMKPVKSSNVESIGYHNGIMAVKFKNGDLYHYHEVPEEAHRACMKCDSIGSFLHQHIKGKHAHTKVA